MHYWWNRNEKRIKILQVVEIQPNTSAIWNTFGLFDLYSLFQTSVVYTNNLNHLAFAYPQTFQIKHAAKQP